MKNILIMLAVAVTASLSVAAGVQNAAPQEQLPTAPVSSGLADLQALTKSCSMAALNAAARRAAAAPTQGKYQFSYFNLITDSHLARYEVHFTSNYEGEPALKYCVEIYCQQGWDPKTAKAQITVLSDPPKRGSTVRHKTGCGQMHAPTKGRTGK